MTQTTTYNSHEHLIKIKGKDGQVKDYLPANWRLHELRVTCPTATIESEIVFMDQEHNFVIVKAVIYDGKSYEESSRRASSMKQGLLTSLDKVETGAKSRAARDFGIGTEFALEAEPEEDLDPAPTPPQQQNSTPLATTIPKGKPTLSVVPQPLLVELQGMYTYARDLKLIDGLSEWEALKVDILGKSLHDEEMTAQDVDKMKQGLSERKKKVASKK